MTATLFAATAGGDYISWGVIAISRTNALIILGMIVLFVLAIVVPFPKPPEEPRR